jgi:(1->4)-alpha-D-glucan 1-alpha-D-glucosylmutase
MTSAGQQQEVARADAAGGKRVPVATYRLQFNRNFTFRQAVELADYLCELGVSDCYASPLFKAGAESAHGYDVCGFDEINPELGGEDDFNRLIAKLRQLGLGLLLDIVPNHMGADLSNAWWRDVLEKGRGSTFASYFDIDWESTREELRGKVLMPVLEDEYEKVLASGKLRLAFEDGTFFIAYHEKKFPVSPESLSLIEKERAARQDFLQLVGSPGVPVTRPADTLSPSDGERDGVRGLEAPRIGQAVGSLRALLEQQHYRLAHWRTASEQINYRRFFDVTELVSLRMELPEVFDACHGLVFRLIGNGQVTGLRVDHPDGLWSPKNYFARLQEKAPRPVYVVAEKILSGEERLPDDWRVDGTTGYDFLNRLNGLFVNAANKEAFDRIYREFTGAEMDFREVAYASKKRVLETSFGSELTSLAARLKRIAESTSGKRAFSLPELQTALAEVVATFSVYRTYINEDTIAVPPDQRAIIEDSVREARERNRAVASDVFDLSRDVLQLRLPENPGAKGHRCTREFVMKFQQLTGPVMAKGVEDTAFYRYHRFVSLNEVGGDPARFGVSVEGFHRDNGYMREHWPHSLLATATHDTKRGEDVRARLNALSEMPDAWRDAVARWARLNANKKILLGNAPAPDANDEYLLYQTLVGAWPHDADTSDGRRNFRKRIASYMLKAIREAKVHTSWTEPNAPYEEALRRFVERTLAEGTNAFLGDFGPFQRKVAFFGTFNSLAQVLVKITSPGLPDFYQGSELWDLSLVDPDNRRPVDFDLRRQLLAELKSMSGDDRTALIGKLFRESHTGQIKMFVIQRALAFRRAHARLFEEGNYVPVRVEGPCAEHVIAYLREGDGDAALTVVPRLVFGLTDGVERLPVGAETWQDTRVLLPGWAKHSQWRNVFTNEFVSVTEWKAESALRLSEALSSFPLALLEAEH